MNILVTGGLGYIGSHTVVELIKNELNVIIVDNLINSSYDNLKNIEKITGIKPTFYNFDVTKDEIEEIFINHKIDGIIHFAALKSIDDSNNYPLKYYSNNVGSLINLLEKSKKFNIKKIIFSSSAAVYGKEKPPLNENMKILETENPYAETKKICEKILIDFGKQNIDYEITILRYFNPIGCHESYLIGEFSNKKASNLMPQICKVALGESKNLKIYGSNYDTSDGSGIRDFIHVTDLADAHFYALKNIKAGCNIYNVGTGKGYTVLEIVKKFEIVNKLKIPFVFYDRRIGDSPISFANVDKIKNELGWKAKKTIEDMVRDVWEFHQKNGGNNE